MLAFLTGQQDYKKHSAVAPTMLPAGVVRTAATNL